MLGFLDRGLQRVAQARVFSSLGLEGVSSRWTASGRVEGCWSSLVLLETESSRGGRRIGGYALDRSAHRSALRALMEGLESLAARDGGIDLPSRTGLAAHESLPLARASAYRELVERDAFLFHWLSESPMRPLDLEFPFSEPLRRRYQPTAAELRSADPAVKVACAAARHPEHGCWLLGLGAADRLDVALAKAWTEWLSAVVRHAEIGSCPEGSPPAPGEPARKWIQVHHQRSKERDIARLLGALLAGPARAELDAATPGSSFSPAAATEFTDLPVRSGRYAVTLARNPGLLPLEFGPAFHERRCELLDNPRLRGELLRRGPGSFHPEGRFLDHPFD